MLRAELAIVNFGWTPCRPWPQRKRSIIGSASLRFHLTTTRIYRALAFMHSSWHRTTCSTRTAAPPLNFSIGAHCEPRGSERMDMTLAEAQTDMRRGYCSGAAGILASAIAWSCAAGTAIVASPQRAMWVLLIGGVLIFPASVLICRLLGARGSHSKGNPLGPLAGASTFWLVFCILVALVLGLLQVQWFFPAMLLVIGGRYLSFATIYGMRLYWGLGLVLAAAGLGYGALVLSPFSVPIAASILTGAVIEVSFAVACLIFHFQWERSNNSSKRTRVQPRAV